MAKYRAKVCCALHPVVVLLLLFLLSVADGAAISGNAQNQYQYQYLSQSQSQSQQQQQQQQQSLNGATIYADKPNHQQAIHHGNVAGTRSEPHVLDRFNNRYPDGSYEYRFELSDGTARYERGYFAFVNDVKTLIVVGYYSYRMSDARYLTVFYNADQYGYRQNQSITPQIYPNLPRSIDVPGYGDTKQAKKAPTKPIAATTTATTTYSNSKINSNNNKQSQLNTNY